MISSRYALPVLLVLVVALIPTVIHSYLGATLDDGRTTAAIEPVLAGFTSAPAGRNPEWGREVFGSDDWIERIYRRPGEAPVRLFVARGYDQKKLYHHPELALSYGSNLRADGTRTLPGEPAIPVHLLRSRERDGLVAYALLYDGEFITDPISHQIGDAFNMLFGPARPMTLFYVADPRMPVNQPFPGSPPAEVLRAAIDSFLSQKSPD